MRRRLMLERRKNGCNESGNYMKPDTTQAQEKDGKMNGAVADDDNGLDCLMCILNGILAPPLLGVCG